MTVEKILLIPDAMYIRQPDICVLWCVLEDIAKISFDLAEMEKNASEGIDND